MINYASKLEFEEAAKLRDEINRLKAKQVGIPKKILSIQAGLELFVEVEMVLKYSKKLIQIFLLLVVIMVQE